MEKRICKHTGAAVSLLGYGCMRFPGDGESVDYAKAEPLIDAAYAAGVNYFDTAYRYHGGASELFVGHALAKYPRESFHLATKLPPWMVDSLEDAERIFADQLERLRVEYFDFYLVHALNRTTWEKMERLGVYELLARYKREGKIRRLGFSFHDTPAVLEEICAAHPWDFVQIQHNYLDWALQDAKGQYDVIERHGCDCIVMEPVRGGALATLCDESAAVFKAAAPNRSVASWAVRFAATLPNVLTVLSGMSTMEQVEDNLATLSPFAPLTAQDYKTIDAALDAYRKKVTVPCTACRYCVEGCPQAISIPDLFARYNQFAVGGDRDRFRTEYAGFDPNAEACVACGACVEICPQHIDIPAMMKTLAEKARKE